MWRSTLWMNLINDESSTNYKLKRKKKREKKWKMWRIFKAQNAEDSKCFKCAAWSALFITKQAVITSKFFHHFARISSLLDAMRGLDGASFRWRELSIALTRVAPPPDLGTNGIFVTHRKVQTKSKSIDEWINYDFHFIWEKFFENSHENSKTFQFISCDAWFFEANSAESQSSENY